ncbi:MAG: S9 family peptidase [Chlorobia bacterium]|nr:S9 family peptidase [Fimbriimonadaceae bacterium]
MRRMHTVVLVLGCLATVCSAQRTFKPSPGELKEAYVRANEYQKRAENAAFNLTLTMGWIGNGDSLWYRRDSTDGKKEFIRVDCLKKSKAPAFDHKGMATSLSTLLGREIDAEKLPFNAISFDASSGGISFQVTGAGYRFDPATGKATKGGEFDAEAVVETELEKEPNPEYPAPYVGSYSPPLQQDANARVREGQVEVRINDVWTVVSKQGAYARAVYPQGASKVVAFRLIPGERRLVYLLKAAVTGTSRAALEQRMYDQPGDKLDQFETWVIDPQTKVETKLDLAPIMGGGQPWANPPGTRVRGTKVFFDFPIRGYQEHKVVVVDAVSGQAKTVVEEKSATFLDQSKTNYWIVGDGKKLIWQSERDGWSHLYMVDTESGETKQITKGPWVVRGVSHVDETKGQIWFTACGFGNPAKEDPYHIHQCRVNLDGAGFVQLTKGDGTHAAQFSQDRRLFVDSYSRIDSAPVHELRNSETGELVVALEKAGIERLEKNGVRLPERFVAKARDGKSDIWGIVIRPSNFDPNKKYPVIENIYAGPHDSFVPKGFRPFYNMHRLAELGFIVVQIDGMGTNNRGKAFHDVAWKNVADAGFPDRILWLRALAKKYPQVDIERVGVYGTSAGGQSSTGGMLTHGDFYKVAVSSCGCHDNRIDKQWWNEQWMGYPVGPHYDGQSNITMAKQLKGKLMLIVGEQDRNVPPETTFRLADALIRAQKEFDLVVIPGADHTDGGPYGERKRRDFFVRWLHGVEPPSWND